MAAIRRASASKRRPVLAARRRPRPEPRRALAHPAIEALQQANWKAEVRRQRARALVNGRILDALAGPSMSDTRMARLAQWARRQNVHETPVAKRPRPPRKRFVAVRDLRIHSIRREPFDWYYREMTYTQNGYASADASTSTGEFACSAYAPEGDVDRRMHCSAMSAAGVGVTAGSPTTADTDDLLATIEFSYSCMFSAKCFCYDVASWSQMGLAIEYYDQGAAEWVVAENTIYNLWDEQHSIVADTQISSTSQELRISAKVRMLPGREYRVWAHASVGANGWGWAGATGSNASSSVKLQVKSFHLWRP